MTGPLPTPPMERLLARAAREGECLVVQNASHPDGYAIVHSKGRGLYAHRVAYEHYHGTIPEGMVVRHTCDNPPCIERDHLVIGTKRQNNEDAWERGRSARSPFADRCAHGHPYTEENTYRNSKGHRSCRECRRKVMREYDRRRRQMKKNKVSDTQ